MLLQQRYHRVSFAPAGTYVASASYCIPSDRSTYHFNCNCFRFFCLFSYGKIVDYLITRTKVALVSRERTKKSLLLALHQFRLAFLQLGSLLAQEAVIPSSSLVFYYTVSELKQIIEDSDSTKSIVRK